VQSLQEEEEDDDRTIIIITILMVCKSVKKIVKNERYKRNTDHLLFHQFTLALPQELTNK